jgi:hypothetical protein
VALIPNSEPAAVHVNLAFVRPYRTLHKTLYPIPAAAQMQTLRGPRLTLNLLFFTETSTQTLQMKIPLNPVPAAAQKQTLSGPCPRVP